MPADWTVRRASLNDAAVIAAYNAAMALETEGVRLDPQRLAEGVRAVLEDPSKGFYLLADGPDGVAGQVMITYEWSDWRNGVFWWFQSVYVTPHFRRAGVFRMLFQAVEDAARVAGNVCGLRLYVEQDNALAQATYERFGLHTTHYHMMERDESGVRA